MKEDKFAQQMEAMHSYVAALQRRLSTLPWEPGQPGSTLLPAEAFEEVSTASEELQVTLEELRQQNEELTVARAAIETERQRYQDLFEFAPDGYLVTDGLGVIRKANRAAAALLNVSQPFLMRKPLINFITQAERQYFRSELAHLHQKVSPVREWEVRLQSSRGGPFDAVLKVAVVRNQQGEPITLLWLLRDITIRKQAEVILLRVKVAEAAKQELEKEIAERQRVEAALRESEAKFRSLIQNSSDIIVILAADGIVQYASPSFERILGYQQTDLAGKNAFAFIHPEDVVNTLGEFSKLVQVGGVQRQEFRVQHQDGSWCFLEATGSNLLNDPSVGGIVVNSRDITERKQTEAQLLHDAFHDALTDLPNRALFMDRLQHALEHGKRHQDYLFAVLFLDLDRFKIINDSLGHILGDQLLIAVANRLKACLRSEDTVARLGGDEFTILLEDITDISDVGRVAERLQAELTLPFNLDGQEVFITASIGVTLHTLPPSEEIATPRYQRPEELLRDADNALYRAKELGKARYAIFNTDMHTQAVVRLQLETELQRAIERQEFRIHYQPIVLLATGRIVGFEALVRWQHPERGLVFPGEFLSVAEEIGLSIPIDQWVLQAACRQAKQWQGEFPNPPLTISVNLCSRSFRQPELLQSINRALQDTHLPATRLKLEITENIMMEDKFVSVRLQKLRDLGIQLAIDDFGTGYSSLGRLHRFPINELKIDRSFIMQIGVNNGNLEITETIVTLAQKLGVDVTAEGVETAEQLARLRALKCNYGQGYFFSQPLDAEAAATLIMSKPQW